MEASILDLRKHMSKVIAAIDKNEKITLTYRGKEKAVIVPIKAKVSSDLTKHKAFGMWADRDNDDVEAELRAMRKGRFDAI